MAMAGTGGVANKRESVPTELKVTKILSSKEIRLLDPKEKQPLEEG